MKKESLLKHVNSEQHSLASDIQIKSELGAVPYFQNICDRKPIGKSAKKMAEKDRENTRVKFNSSYYLAKKERLFRDYPDLLELQKKNHVPIVDESYANAMATAEFTDYIALPYI